MKGSFHPVLVYQEKNEDIPPWVHLNRERYSHFVDRRNEWAGFQDLQLNKSLEIINMRNASCKDIKAVEMPAHAVATRRVIDYFLYNGEVDVL
ncbi:hypothetical protein HDU98_008476 [Podochytrium sp. JEL0797]|nr:hypothetical protein HDU98_008476 [Podochytrium sp. JEL0797]